MMLDPQSMARLIQILARLNGVSDAPTTDDRKLARAGQGSFDGRLMSWGGQELGPTSQQMNSAAWDVMSAKNQAAMKQNEESDLAFWRQHYAQQIADAQALDRDKAQILANASQEDRNFARYGSILGDPTARQLGYMNLNEAKDIGEGWTPARQNPMRTPQETLGFWQVAPWGYTNPLPMLDRDYGGASWLE